MKIRPEPALFTGSRHEIIMLVFPERNGLLPAVSIIASPGAFSVTIPGRCGPFYFFPSGCLKNSPMFRSAASSAAPLLKKNVEFPEEQHS